jgi:N-acylneuraminate cytidylyltransferase
MKANIIAIIPARGGSKGILRKNLLSFCGQPLLRWSVKQALAAKRINEVYVSSDDKEILAEAKKSGAIALQRPNHLATDTATSEDVLIQVLKLLEEEKKKKIDLVVFLQATSPLRVAADIDNAIETFIKQKADSLFSCSILEDYCIWQKKGDKFSSLNFDYHKRGRRQDRQPLFLENGSMYIFKPKILKEEHNRLGGKVAVFLMDAWQSNEIDSYADVDICEYFMKKYVIKRR